MIQFLEKVILVGIAGFLFIIYTLLAALIYFGLLSLLGWVNTFTIVLFFMIVFGLLGNALQEGEKGLL